jgi:hypothetical protein
MKIELDQLVRVPEQISAVINQNHRVYKWIVCMHRGPWRAKGHGIRLSFDLAIKNIPAAWRDGLGTLQQTLELATDGQMDADGFDRKNRTLLPLSISLLYR